jgi:hypothetical protein
VFINLNQGWIVIFYENMNKVDKKSFIFLFNKFCSNMWFNLLWLQNVPYSSCTEKNIQQFKQVYLTEP